MWAYILELSGRHFFLPIRYRFLIPEKSLLKALTYKYKVLAVIDAILLNIVNAYLFKILLLRNSGEKEVKYQAFLK